MTRKRASTPASSKLLPINFLRLWFSTVGRWLPGFSARIAYRIWFSTRRFPTPLREQQWLRHASQSTFDCNGLPVALYQWGEARPSVPSVVLVHGWNGRAAQMGAIAVQLVKAGYCALAVDLPAHGSTPGNRTDVLHMADVLRQVIQQNAPVHGVVTHSFGLFPVAMLLQQGLVVNRVVCLSPADNYRYLLEQYADAFELTPKIFTQLCRLIEKKYGADLWERISPSKNVAKLNLPALIIHDEDDNAVAVEHAIQLAHCWPGAQLIKTNKLGHQRILRDKQVIEKIVSHIAQ